MGFDSKKLTNSPVPGIAGEKDDCCPEWWFDEDGSGTICTNIPSCGDGSFLKFPKSEDKFVTGEVSEDGSTLTLVGLPDYEGEPNAAPVSICLNPIKGAVYTDADGATTEVTGVDGILQLEKPETYCWSLNEAGCVELSVPHCGTGEKLVLEFVQGVTGNVVDNTDPKNPVITAVASVTGPGVDNTDPLNPIISGTSSTEPSADGTQHIITTADEVQTAVCLDPVKSISGDGVDNTDPQNPVVSSSFAVPSADGTQHVITTADNIQTPVCLDPVKSVSGPGVDNTDPANPVIAGGSSTVPSADGTQHIITTADEVQTAVCLDPVKSVSGGIVDATDPANPVISETVTGIAQGANGIIVYTNELGQSQQATTKHSSTIGQGNGFRRITTDDGNSTDVCANQYKGLRTNPDGTQTEIFVNQLGNEVPGETIAAPSQSGEPQLGAVDAAGMTTYIDSAGASQTVPAVDVNGAPVDPSQAVWNMIDGQGNYLGSKPCQDETVLAEDGAGGVYPVNPVTGNQVIELPEVAETPDLVCEEDPEFDNTLIINLGDQRLRFAATRPQSRVHNFAAGLNGEIVFDDNSVPQDTYGEDEYVPYEFTINNCSGVGCWEFDGLQEYLLVPAVGGVAGLVIFSEHQICDAAGTPVTGWVSNGRGGNTTVTAVDRDHEVQMPFKAIFCGPNGTYQIKMRVRVTVLKGYTDPGWSMRAQTSTFHARPDYIELSCCDLPVLAIPIVEPTTELNLLTDEGAALTEKKRR